MCNKFTILFTTLILLIFCSIAQSKDIQQFNTDVLGADTSKEIKLLQDKMSDDIEPTSVMVDTQGSRYIAAIVTYPSKVTFEDARDTLNGKYKKYENFSLYKESEMAVWRVEDERFAISLTKNQERIQVIYIKFQSNKEVFKNIMKSMGSDSKVFDNKDCK